MSRKNKVKPPSSKGFTSDGGGMPSKNKKEQEFNAALYVDSVVIPEDLEIPCFAQRELPERVVDLWSRKSGWKISEAVLLINGIDPDVGVPTFMDVCEEETYSGIENDDLVSLLRITRYRHGNNVAARLGREWGKAAGQVQFAEKRGIAVKKAAGVDFIDPEDFLSKIAKPLRLGKKQIVSRLLDRVREEAKASLEINSTPTPSAGQASASEGFLSAAGKPKRACTKAYTSSRTAHQRYKQAVDELDTDSDSGIDLAAVRQVFHRARMKRVLVYERHGHDYLYEEKSLNRFIDAMRRDDCTEADI